MLDDPRVFTGISTKYDGSCRLQPPRNEPNRQRFLKGQGIDPNMVISADLVHGNDVFAVERNDAGRTIPAADGLWTGERGIFLSVTVADCLPIFLYDPKKNAAGLLHAGWRGLASSIIREGLAVHERAFGGDPGSLSVFIGPYIHACHFEAQNDLQEKFSGYPAAFERRGNKVFIDLGVIAMEQLETRRVPARNIRISEECTYCLEDKYFSYRRDKPKDVEAMIALIGML